MATDINRAEEIECTENIKIKTEELGLLKQVANTLEKEVGQLQRAIWISDKEIRNIQKKFLEENNKN